MLLYLREVHVCVARGKAAVVCVSLARSRERLKPCNKNEEDHAKGEYICLCSTVFRALDDLWGHVTSRSCVPRVVFVLCSGKTEVCDFHISLFVN